MRVLSMVPSWTETLLACGVEVVGRTRFCIHPEGQVRSLPAVGGTKDVDWEKVRELRPDLLLLDREENPLKMAEESPVEVFATHVQRIEDVAMELERLAQKIGGAAKPALQSLALRWRKVEAAAPLIWQDWSELPGVMEWICQASSEKRRAAYLIWREPWMAASPATFIGSVLDKIGVDQLWAPREAKYPSFDFQDIPSDAVLLCSSEPFPFAKAKFRKELLASGRACALVDGEVLSWFGLRSLGFLEHALKLS